MQPMKKTIVPMSILVVIVFGFQANAPAESYRYDPAGRLIKVACQSAPNRTILDAAGILACVLIS